MKTKKLLVVLPMVAILAACNKTAAKDVFAKLRSKVPADSASIQTDVGAFRFVTHYSYVTRLYEKENGNWEYQNVNSRSLYSVTNYQQDWHVVSLGYEESETFSEEDTLTPCFTVRRVGGGDTYEITESNYQYKGTPKNLWHNVYNSVFSWKARFFSGATYYLCAKNGDDFMPQAAINKLTKSFATTKKDNLITVSGGNADLVYKDKKGNTIAINSFKVVYEDHKMIQYNTQLAYSILVNDRTRNDVLLSIDTATVLYD